MFKGRQLLIATKHQKEKVIAPIVEKALGVHCFIDPEFDSDVLGTFSGEIERKDDPLSTARKKCMLAMERNNCDLAIASEGSFGNHPSCFILPANEEILLLKDLTHNLEIAVRHITTKTNFARRKITSWQELRVFASEVDFPSHALILRREEHLFESIRKGLSDWTALKEAFSSVSRQSAVCFAETDMRAMHNPTRMSVIKETTEKLVKEILSECPGCGMPGFVITESVSGLPCAICATPTLALKAVIYTCRHCNFSRKVVHPEGKITEDPERCEVCNP